MNTKILNSTFELVEKLRIGHGKKIRPLLCFIAYNGLVKNSNIGQLKRNIMNLLQTEQSAKECNLLPTIGIEIECFRNFFTDKKVGILHALGIPNHSPEEHLREVNPDHSFSYLVQAAYLTQLVVYGVIPLWTEDGSGIVDPKYNHSLHINFGIPRRIIKIFFASSLALEDKYWEEISIFSDAMSYAFASPQRLAKGEYAVPVKIHLEDGRLEYRANEFRSLCSYQLLKESQILAGLLFAYLLENEKAAVCPSEYIRSGVWKSFKKEFKSLLKKHEVPFLDMIGSGNTRPHIIKILTASLLSRETRSLIWRFLYK